MAKQKSINEIAVASLKLTIEKRTTIPILSFVNVVAVENGKHLAVATDLDAWAFAPVENLKPGIHQIVGNELCPVDMEVKNFPDWKPAFDDAYKVTGFAKATWNEIDRVFRCISREESRYTLNGALFETRDNTTYLVSTDGHRLSLNTLKHGGATKGRVMVVRRALDIAKKLLPKDGVLTIDLYKKDDDAQTQASFSIGDVRFTFRGMSGQFPNYEAVVSKTIKHQWRVNRMDLLGAVKTLLPFIKGEPNQSVKLDRKTNTLALTVKSDLHTKTVEIPATFVDLHVNVPRRDVSIVMPMRLDTKLPLSTEFVGLNLTYLKDFAESMTSSGTLVLGLTDNNNALTVAASFFTEEAPEDVKGEEQAAA
jgi:hypothetical protein